MDFFASQFFSNATESARAVVGSAIDSATETTVGKFVGQLAAGKAETTTTGTQDSGTLNRAKLPFAEPMPASSEASKRSRAPSAIDAPEAELNIVRDRKPAQTEVSIDSKEEDFRLSLAPSKWNGKPQLLPIPMLVSDMSEKRASDIRGPGWIAIDIAKSQIIPVELFKGLPKSGVAKAMIEARRLDGREVLSSMNTGFPIVRGVSDLRVGSFEVFENPPCSVRFGGVPETEMCEISLRNSKVRYKFEPPKVGEFDARSGLELSDVYIEVAPGRWKQIGSFNENFYPIGDANRDGFPDFYAESVTSNDNSGVQTLILSHQQGDSVDYLSYSARFRSLR